MTGVLWASSLIHWGQCSRELQEHLRPRGGGESSWVVYYEAASAKTAEGPKHLQHPWVHVRAACPPGSKVLLYGTSGVMKMDEFELEAPESHHGKVQENIIKFVNGSSTRS